MIPSTRPSWLKKNTEALNVLNRDPIGLVTDYCPPFYKLQASTQGKLNVSFEVLLAGEVRVTPTTFYLIFTHNAFYIFVDRIESWTNFVETSTSEKKSQETDGGGDKCDDKKASTKVWKKDSFGHIQVKLLKLLSLCASSSKSTASSPYNVMKSFLVQNKLTHEYASVLKYESTEREYLIQTAFPFGNQDNPIYMQYLDRLKQKGI